MLSLLWKGSFVTGFAVVTALAVTPAEVPDGPIVLPNRPVPELVDALNSEEEPIRRAATERLLALDAGSIPEMATAMQGRPLRRNVAILSILEEHLLSHDPAVAEAATVALEQLESSDRLGLATRASQVLDANAAVLQARAIAELELYGATVVCREVEEHPFEIECVTLGRNWNPEGMKALRRLRNWRVLYVEDGVVLAPEDEQQLRRKVPYLLIRHRGDACLGVGGENRRVGFRITHMDPESGAAAAGLRLEDRIIRFDGEPAGTLQRLVELVSEHRAGDVVRIDVQRGNQTLAFDVQLGDDFGTGECRCESPARSN